MHEFDGRGLVTKQVDALGNVTTFTYDGNGNLVSKTDPDGYTTEYTYNALDLVTSINYNDAKEVSYRYNATGDLHAYYHTDYLGTTDYLTSAVNSKIISWTSYNEWGEITHNAVLKCGQRELDLVKLYATHDYDSVLDMYYAKARLYDADDRRFTAVDPILDPSRYDISEYATDPMQLVQYLYVKDNAVNWIDPLGLMPRDWLNLVNFAYLGGVISADQVFAAVSLLNVLDIATSGVQGILDNIGSSNIGGLIQIIDTLYQDIETDLFETDGASSQSVYLSFHETAQVLASKQILLTNALTGWPALEERHQRKEIDIKAGNYVWEVKPGYHLPGSFDRSLKKYIDPKHYERDKEAKDYVFRFLDLNRNVPGFEFEPVTAKMLEINNKKYNMRVEYLGPGKVGYFFEIQCDDAGKSEVYAKEVVPVVRDIYDTAHEINVAATATVAAVGVFIVTLVSPFLGDEAVGAGAVASAWAAVKSAGLSAGALSVLQGLSVQLGYALP